MEETGLKGYRTTIAFGALVLFSFASLWLGFFSADNLVSLLKDTFFVYVGAKTGYKVAEVIKEKINVKKGQNTNSSEPTV